MAVYKVDDIYDEVEINSRVSSLIYLAYNLVYVLNVMSQEHKEEDENRRG